MTLDLDNSEFSVSGDHKLWGGRSLYSLYQEAFTPWEWHAELFQYARTLNIVPFSTPFDLSALEFLEKLNCPMYKIASLETGDLSLIEAAAKTMKPLIISTGATNWNEIEDMVQTVGSTGNKDLTLLVCTSSYPADPRDANLKRIHLLKNKFDCKIGVSDHTLGIGVSIAGIALGATLVEKHLTISRNDGGADSAFSMEPEEFSRLVNEGNVAYQALGDDIWKISDSERESRRLRRSLYVVQDVKKGDRISKENVRAIRPGAGMPPKYIGEVMGRLFIQDVCRGTALHPDLFNKS
jgi:N-acetylneuraminate synthase